MKTFNPFGPASSTTIGGVTIETDEDSLVLSGSIEMARDRAGLESIERMLAVLVSAAEVLRAQDLPEKAEGAKPAGPKIANPFG